MAVETCRNLPSIDTLGNLIRSFVEPRLTLYYKYEVPTTKIVAIITCFYPKIEELIPLLQSITPQVNKIFLINNGGFDPSTSPEFTKSSIENISAKQNLGTAGGYNLGARLAWEQDYTHILLLDQDSECAPQMVASLLELELFLKSQKKNVAVIGPSYICRSNNEVAPFIQHSGYRIKRIFADSAGILQASQNSTYTECSYVISSGSLISRQAWLAVGDAHEGLFLDFTDIEWGLRAQSKGYKCYGSFSAKMFHLIGDEQAHLFGRKISLHSPLRHYYAFRNCVWLFKQKFIPLGTRSNYLIKLLPKLVIYSFFSNQPFKQISYMLKGLCDGLKNKLGAYEK